MKTISANNYAQAVKEVEVLDKSQVEKVKEQIKHSDRKHNHVVTVKVHDRPGETKNKVIIDTIIVNDDKLEKLKKNFKFLGFSKIVVLHDASQVKEDATPSLHNHEKQQINAQVKADLEAKHKAEIDELKKKYEQDLLDSKKGNTSDQTEGGEGGGIGSDLSDEQKVLELDFTTAIAGNKAEYEAFIEKYKIPSEELKNNDQRNDAITAFYNAKMTELESSKQ